MTNDQTPPAGEAPMQAEPIPVQHTDPDKFPSKADVMRAHERAASPSAPAPQPEPTNDQLSAMVNRFLGWKLPKTFSPDAGIKFTPSNGMSREEAYSKAGWWPVGTNLLTADEAREMIEYIIAAAQKIGEREQ